MCWLVSDHPSIERVHEKVKILGSVFWFSSHFHNVSTEATHLPRLPLRVHWYRLCIFSGVIPKRGQRLVEECHILYIIAMAERVASVDTLWKWLENQNTDPKILTFSWTRFYTSQEKNNLPQCSNLTLHSDIHCIDWPSIILGFIPKSLARTQQTYLTHIGSKNGTQIGHPNHHTNLETILRLIDPPQ